MANEIWQEKWSEWESIKKIGEGTFGKVYKCRHKRIGNEPEMYCAIKVITTTHQDVMETCVDEISTMIRLRDEKHIVGIEDYLVIERGNGMSWDICIKMELLTSLSNYIGLIGPENFTEFKVINMGMQLCKALDSLASANILHRDIKPDNIFVDDKRDFKLGDFGIARMLSMSQLEYTASTGTPLYMAPEVDTRSVAKKAQYDVRADLYSLGLVMYQYVNHGRLPFMDPNAPAISQHEKSRANSIRMEGKQPIPAPDGASPELAAVLLKVCDPDPEKRYGSAHELEQALLQAKKAILQKNHPEANKPAVAKQKEAGKKTAPVQQKEVGKRTAPAQQKEAGKKTSGTQKAKAPFNTPPAKKPDQKKGMSTMMKVATGVIIFLVLAIVLIVVKFGVMRKWSPADSIAASETEQVTQTVTETQALAKQEYETETETTAETAAETAAAAQISDGPAYAGANIAVSDGIAYTEYTARGSTFTMSGDVYDKGVAIKLKNDSVYVTFSLQDNYKYMAGMFGAPENDVGSFVLNISGSNGQQIGTLSHTQYDVETPFLFDIEGIHEITIALQNTSSYDCLAGLGNLVFYNDEDDIGDLHGDISWTRPAICGKSIHAYAAGGNYLEYADIGTDFTVAGVKYVTGFTSDAVGSSSYCHYYLNGQYDRLTGTLGLVKEEGKITLRIFGDGTPLQVVTLSSESKSIPINLDISGIRQLSILCDETWGTTNNAVIGFGNMIFE